ncbi:hypothetical protein LIER_28764 [Lithospermum erythrorhizon]|uniref:Uncharacterized protein n=1 Tax=Lithospermum erythrorhizon TaxID=34254 RepID=A0AAV3RHX0_LITER
MVPRHFSDVYTVLSIEDSTTTSKEYNTLVNDFLEAFPFEGFYDHNILIKEGHVDGLEKILNVKLAESAYALALQWGKPERSCKDVNLQKSSFEESLKASQCERGRVVEENPKLDQMYQDLLRILENLIKSKKKETERKKIKSRQVQA